MVRKAYINAVSIFHRKLTVIHIETNIRGICELKAWQVPVSKKYPLGIKYSLFCVDFQSKEVIIGFDNHYPKGPHKHRHQTEDDYEYLSLEKLVDDFWNELKTRGYN